MIRIVVQLLAAFALPIALYALYFGYQRWRARRLGTDAPRWEDSPWFWLIFAGAVLAVVAFLVFGLSRETSPEFILPPSGGRQ